LLYLLLLFLTFKNLHMRMKILFGFFTMSILFATVFISCDKDLSTTISNDSTLTEISELKSEPITGQYIVVLNDEGARAEVIPSNYQAALTAVMEMGREIVKEAGIDPDKVFVSYASAIVGFAVRDISPMELSKLSRNDEIQYIEQDQTVSVVGGPPGGGGGGGSCANNNAEMTPCGIPLVNGGQNYTGNKKAYILDTGIDLTHADLNVANYGFNAFTNGRDGNSLNDGNGHGTHCAGTLAAIGGNNIGVVGVAAGALVVPVKVLDSRGSGSISGVIAGVDYVGANGNSGDVANMSLGGGASTALDNAVLNASSGGVWFVIAAGNSSADANNYSPARVNGPYVRTISSMTCSATWSSFSNFGMPPIDWIAPGSAICSTYKDGGYASLSGTSMAAPHAAGVILIKQGNPNSCGNVSHSSGSYPRICN
jgi:subtilisin family serine protease